MSSPFDWKGQPSIFSKATDQKTEASRKAVTRSLQKQFARAREGKQPSSVFDSKRHRTKPPDFIVPDKEDDE